MRLARKHMAVPETDTLMLASILLGALAAVLAVALARRWREGRRLRDLVERLHAVTESGDLAERLAPHAGEGSPADIATGVDRLIERLQSESATRREREDVYRRLLDSVHEAMLVERDGIQVANARFAELCGVPSPARLGGRRLEELVLGEYSGLVAECLRRHVAGQSAPPRLEVELQCPGGPPHRLELSFARMSFDGRPAVMVTGVEMTPRVMPQPNARSHATAWEALDSMAESVLTTDVEGRIVYVNKAGEQLLGNPAGQVIGRTLGEVIELVEEGDRKTLGDPVRQCIATGQRVSLGRRGMLVSSGSDGERSIEVTVSPMRDAAERVDGAVIALRDVTDLRGLTRALSYQASRDGLTGLVNRGEFLRRLEEGLDATGSGTRHVLCYLDLDRFKAINDECGHVAGDSMLREVAGLLKDAVRDSDTVGRLGGDEFGILLAGCPLEKARQIADDLVRAVNDHRFVWKDKIFTVGVSVGLVEIAGESTTIEDLLHAADMACYVAKKQGGHVHVYSARDEAIARQRGEFLWLQRLETALKENRFELHAQPIVPVAAAEAEGGPGLEVLLRLKDEKGAVVPPAEFMRAAERYRLMPHVDRWVVQTALTALARGAIRLAPDRVMCINLSGQTLGDAAFLEFVVDCLDRTGVAPGRLCFEVTENSVITNVEHARRFIGVLHGMGCRFALDDFGRGFSSFANLRHLSLDYLKIDGSFIRNLASDNVNQAMVTAMIKLARSLNFQVIAEQVEDLSALDSARRMGVDYVQGYQVGRPAPLPLAS